MKRHTSRQASLIRSFTFGVEDSLASTVGLLSGVASAQVGRETVVITGLILIFTEALSMAVGIFLSEQSVEEYAHKKDLPLATILPSALVMFFSYLLAGLIPIAPYVFFSHPYSIYLSVALSILSLGGLGVINSKLSNLSAGSHVLRMIILGGSVTITGVLVGVFLKQFGV